MGSLMGMNKVLPILFNTEIEFERCEKPENW